MRYILALLILLLFSGGLTGFFGYMASKEVGVASKEKNEIKSLENQYRSLENEKANIKNSVSSDQSFEQYFTEWESKEGPLNQGALVAKLTAIAQQEGVRVFESGGASGTPSTELTDPTMDPMQGGMPSRNPMDGMPPSGGAEVMNSQFDMVLVGAFEDLMGWVSAAETQISSCRIIKTIWTARSSEEVRLAVTIQYRRFR